MRLFYHVCPDLASGWLHKWKKEVFLPLEMYAYSSIFEKFCCICRMLSKEICLVTEGSTVCMIFRWLSRHPRLMNIRGCALPLDGERPMPWRLRRVLIIRFIGFVCSKMILWLAVVVSLAMVGCVFMYRILLCCLPIRVRDGVDALWRRLWTMYGLTRIKVALWG